MFQDFTEIIYEEVIINQTISLISDFGYLKIEDLT